MNLTSPFNKILNSRQLLAFVTVAKTQSFTTAGRELYLSQSAVSHAIKALEDEVGQPLLDRHGKNIRITPSGEHLLHFAEKILGEMGAARSSLEQRRMWGTSRLRVAANGGVGTCLMPDILKGFRENYPDAQITVRDGDAQECVQWLSDNVIDVAITVAPSRAEAVEMTPLFVDEMMWIVPPEHPWAGSGVAPLEDVSSQVFICNDTLSYSSRLLEKYLERDGVRLNYGLELGSLDAVREVVKAGAGITALGPWAVRRELEDRSLVAVPLGKRKLRRNWCLLRSPDRKTGLAGEVFSKLLLNAVATLSPYAGVATLLVNVLIQLGAADPDAGVAWNSLCENLAVAV